MFLHTFQTISVQDTVDMAPTVGIQALMAVTRVQWENETDQMTNVTNEQHE